MNILSITSAVREPRCCALRMAHPHRGRQELPPPLRGTSLGEGGKFYLAQGGYASARAIKLVAKGVTCYAYLL